MKEKSKEKIWNYISAVGTLATLIFGLIGVFLVPSYVKDAYNQKKIQANTEIVSDLKELIYSSDTIKVSIVNTLRTGKEIKFGITIPFTQIEILTEVQESFFNDKYLQFEKRNSLLKKIEILKNDLPTESKIVRIQKSESNGILIIIYIVSALSLIVSVILFISFLSKRKQLIAEDFQKKFEEIEESKPDSILNYRNFKNKVCEILNNMHLDFEDYSQKPSDKGFDFMINHNNNKIGIEVKSHVNSDSLKNFKVLFDKLDLDALIIISYKQVDFSMFSYLSDLNEKIAGRPIYFISGLDLGTVEKDLMKILNVEIK